MKKGTLTTQISKSKEAQLQFQKNLKKEDNSYLGLAFHWENYKEGETDLMNMEPLQINKIHDNPDENQLLIVFQIQLVSLK